MNECLLPSCLWPVSGLPLAPSPKVRYLLIMTESFKGIGRMPRKKENQQKSPGLLPAKKALKNYY